MIAYFFVFVALSIPYEPWFTVDDEHYTAQEETLAAPMDAVHWQGKIFIADYKQNRVFIAEPNQTLRAFGKKGGAPGEFENFPQTLSIEGNRLKVSEWNDLRVSFFNPEGTYLDRKKSDHTHVQIGPHQLLLLQPNDAIEKGKLYRFAERDAYLGDMMGQTDKDFHLSRGFPLAQDEESILLVSFSGRISAYNLDGRRTASMTVPLELYKLPVAENKRNTAIYKAMGGKVKAFDHGVPVLSATNRKDRVWLLVRHEEQDTRTLFEVDTTRKKVLWQTSVPKETHRIKYHDGVLVLVEGFNSRVIAYRVPD